MTAELQQVLRCAGEIGRWPGGPATVSFTSLFLAMLVTDDATSRWVAATAQKIGPTTQAILDHWAATRGNRAGVTLDSLDAIRSRPPPSGEPGMTSSASHVMAEAFQIVMRIARHAPLDVQHVVAAYIYRPDAHWRDLQGWGFDRHAWALAFQAFVQATTPDLESEWHDYHRATLPQPVSVGVTEVLAWASATGQRREPPAAELDAALLLRGIILDGAQHSDSEVTSSRLFHMLDPAAGEHLAELRPFMTVDLPLGDEAWAVMERAERFRPTCRDGCLHVRHVLAALLTEREARSAHALLRRYERSPQSLLAALRGWVDGPGIDDDLALWDRLLAESPRAPTPLAAYSNDNAEGVDMLGIDRDVEAFAAVLASRDLIPPLAVGLFGDWGSGKSFFMDQLRRRIQILANHSKHLDPDATRFHGEIEQITFNAWHFMDSNLWASLITHVFEELNAGFAREDKQNTVNAYVSQLASVTERREEVRSKATVLQARQMQIDGELGDLQKQREARSKSILALAGGALEEVGKNDEVRAQLDEAAKRLGLPDAKLTVAKAERTQDELRSIGGRVSVWVRLAFSNPRTLLLAVVLVVLLPVVLWSILWGADLLRPAVAGVLGVVTSLLAAAGTVASKTGPIVASIDRALAKAHEVETAVRERKTEQEIDLIEEQRRIAASTAELEQERTTLARRIIELQVEIEGLEAGRSYKQFVLERAASGGYRKELGIISAAHRDLLELSSKLSSKEKPHVDRIILYIDDLDRCPPDRVVEVLQAIHLVLSLPLFVVVVGVDSHWLLQSLEVYYLRHFAGLGVAQETRPQKYLEKIFQIPYAIAPMRRDGFAALVDGLLGRPAEVARTPETRGTGPQAAYVASVGDTPISPAKRTAPKPASLPAALAGPAAPAGHLGATKGSSPATHKIDLLPENLTIPTAEIDHLSDLHWLIGSPRAAKRLINLYRLIRARHAGDDLEWFAADGYRATQLCLAITVGYPTYAAELFSAVFGGEVYDRVTAHAYLHRRAEAEPRWRELVALIAARAPRDAWGSIGRAAALVAPFSFETGRVLRMRDSEAPTPPRSAA